MSSSRNLDFILSSIAVIFEPGPKMPDVNISDEALTQILRRPLSISSAAGGRFLIASARDQIEVQLFSNKIDVRNVSGRQEQGEDRIPKVISEFISLLGNPTLGSYGVNFAIEIYQEQAERWLMSNLLNPAVLGELVEDEVTSNQISLSFERLHKEYTIHLGVRNPDQLHINFNASQDMDHLPGVDQLTVELREQHLFLVDVLDQLGV